MRYTQAERPGFSAIATADGAIYHQRGGYEIATNTGTLIPANRSYKRLESIDPNHIYSTRLSRNNFTNSDRIINDQVDEDIDLKGDERIISVYGKRIFCLDGSQNTICREFSTNPETNPYASKDSIDIIEYLKETTSDCETDLSIGIYGSHQMNINRGNSDIDLIAWAPREGRQDAIMAIGRALELKGYTSAHGHPELLTKYATRYANRMNVSLEAGYIIAAERQRWISPDGVSTSLQCFHADYNHAWAKNVFDNGIENIENKEDTRSGSVRIVSEPEPYDFPRLWSVSINDNDPVDVISVDWAHQGMGSDTTETYTMQARKVTTELGHTAYILSAESDFILPSRMV